ncbi:MAG: replication-relaxation family protein [Opitutaceae bacterium]
MRPDSKKTDPVILQERDMALLRGLFECRTMTAAHAAALYFDGSKEAAKKRLQKLKAAGIVGARRTRVFEPALLTLTPKGTSILREHGILTEYPTLSGAALEKRGRVSDLTIRHELEVMNVKVAFHVTLKKTEKFSIVEFSTWPRLHQFEAVSGKHGAADVIVRPDGFIRIHEKEPDGGLSEHAFYLEVDMSTEAQDVLVPRAYCYLNYYKAGGFAVKNGAPRSDFKDYPFRVLMVFKTVERRNNTAERLLQGNPPILTQVYLSTLEEVRENPLGAIWIRPIDYREATKGTSLAPERQPRQGEYRRQTEREQLIATAAKKHGLFIV